jgi:hypothetical protein
MIENIRLFTNRPSSLEVPLKAFGCYGGRIESG